MEFFFAVAKPKIWTLENPGDERRREEIRKVLFTGFDEMIHRWKAFLDADAGRLENYQTAEREVPHQGSADNASRIVCSVDKGRHVHHHPEQIT